MQSTVQTVNRLPKPRCWIRSRYTILNFRMCEGYQAVYANDPDQTGYCTLFAEPLDAFGVAKIVRQKMCGSDEVGHEYVEQRMVSLRLMDGYWHVCEDCSNFAGSCRVGQDIYDATGELTGAHRVRRPGVTNG